MGLKIATRSSNDELEEQIDAFSTKSGQNKSEIYRRAHVLYLTTKKRKKSKKGE